MYDDYKIKSLHIMLRKTSAYAKSYDCKTNWMYFFFEDEDLLEYVILIRIKSAPVL